MNNKLELVLSHNGDITQEIEKKGKKLIKNNAFFKGFRQCNILIYYIYI